MPTAAAVHHDSTSHRFQGTRSDAMLRATAEDPRPKPGRPAKGARVAMRGASDPAAPSPAKVNGKELMHGLNDRLAGFIEKVHRLEHHNHLLEREIQEVRGKAKPAACLEEEYGAELRRLRQLALDITRQKHQIEIEHQNLEEDLAKLKRQHEQEARCRSDAEGGIVALKRDISEAYQAKLQLDKKAQCLADEILLLRRNHEAEVSEMLDHLRDAEEVTTRAREFGHPGVTAALRDIRAQLEGQAAPDVQQLGETFRSQFARLTEAAESKREALKASQREIQEYRRRLQARNVELDCAKGTREALENQLHDVEDRHKQEILHYQTAIKELENELINCKFDMSGYLREYQDLLNVKMALDVEILSYRKLLCGEEARLSSMSDTHISLPYIYHQSPIYALPCHSRPGGPRRRAEPHYKFVEEIITETTREIEMSEFEETGSEETDMGKDEPGCVKREPGGSEEEEADKDSGEDEGGQMSDGQQNQGSPVGCLVNGGDEASGGSPAESEDMEISPKSEGESEETQIDNEGDSDTDKNTQSKVLKTETRDKNKNEQHSAAENREDKAEAAVPTVQTRLSSKAQDLKPEVPEEGELQTNSEDSKQGHAGEDSFISAPPTKAVDDATSAKESAESDKTQEQSIASKVEEKVKTLVPEKAEETTSSIISENERKDNSHTKEISGSAEEVEDKAAKSIQDEKHDSNKDKDQQSLPKSTIQSPPGVKASQPVDRESTQTPLPKEKSAEIKESH